MCVCVLMVRVWLTATHSHVYADTYTYMGRCIDHVVHSDAFLSICLRMHHVHHLYT